MSLAAESSLIDNRRPELAGQYLSFRLGDEAYALPVRHVREIIEMQVLTPVPRCPETVRGVINLRGKVVPIIDPLVRFGGRSVKQTDSTVMVLVHSASGMPVGLLVDEVMDVLDVDGDSLNAPPGTHGRERGGVLAAVANVKDQVVFVLELDRLLPDDV